MGRPSLVSEAARNPAEVEDAHSVSTSPESFVYLATPTASNSGLGGCRCCCHVLLLLLSNRCQEQKVGINIVLKRSGQGYNRQLHRLFRRSQHSSESLALPIHLQSQISNATSFHTSSLSRSSSVTNAPSGPEARDQEQHASAGPDCKEELKCTREACKRCGKPESEHVKLSAVRGFGETRAAADLCIGSMKLEHTCPA